MSGDPTLHRGGVARGRRAAFGIALVALLVAAAYGPTFPWLGERWQAADGYFSHGPLVPLAAAWAVWQARAELRGAKGGGEWLGLLLVVPALAIHLLARALRYDSPSAWSLLLLLPGLVLLLGGRERLKTLAFPIGFLAFALPLPLFLLAQGVQRLKEVVVTASAAVVNLFGTGVRTEGSFLLLPGGGRLLVDDECSGLKSLLALLALGVFMAGTARELTRPQRWLMVGLALPVALLANIVRVSLLAAIGCAGGASRAAAWHDPSTWAIYVVALLLFVRIEARLKRRAPAGAGP